MTGQKQGRLDTAETQELLETIAFQQATDVAVRGLSHACRLARLKRGVWQADIIRKSKDVACALNATGLRTAMENPAAAVVFLPFDAAVNVEIIERICAESGLEKFIVWEID